MHGPQPRIPDCHPERRHYARGLCLRCYKRPSCDAWRKRNRKRANEISYKSWKKNQLARYGISPETVARLEARQEGRCPIRGRPPTEAVGRLVLDHDHTTGKFRGLICSPCNRGMGLFRDAPSALRAAAAYLERGGQPQ